MGPAETLQTFVDKRAKLIERLEKSRAEIDSWLADNRPDGDISLAKLATLAGVVALSRDALNDLARLDDDFLENIQDFMNRDK